MKTNQSQKNIPDGWERKKLSEIGRALIGLTYSPENVVEDGGILVFRSSNIKSGKIDYSDQVRVSVNISEKNFVKEGDILICARNGSRNLIGKNAYISKEDEGNVFGAFMTVFRAKNPKYIYQLFQSSLYKKEIEMDLGPTINQVTTGNLSRFKFNFPSISEQNRIVLVLETWDKSIKKLTDKIEIKKQIKKGLMQDLLTGKKRLGGFKDKWETVELQDICFVSMGQSPASIAYNEKGLGIPLIQGNNDIKNRKTISRIWTTEVTKKAQKGDIIMTVRAPVGWIGVAMTEVCIGRGVCSIRATKVDQLFILKLLESFESRWKSLEQGSTFTAVNSSDVKALSLQIPKSKEEQSVIAKILNTADNEIIELEKKLLIIKEQKRYILDNLITGTIRTPETLSAPSTK